MKRIITYKKKWYDKFLSFFFRFAASGYIPASWFRASIPDKNTRIKKVGMLNIEIVSHCWRYSNMLTYQLSSLVVNPPTKAHITMSVFYSKEDKETCDLLAYFQTLTPPNVTWNWQAIPKEKLFRRAIGRNYAAKNTKADWVWFTDCDIIFHENCIDSLSEQLQGRNDILCYPRQERATEMLSSDNPILEAGWSPQVMDINVNEFKVFTRDRAKGEYQIAHGDVARTVGYCERVSIYQTPSDAWCKCYDDRAFRWLLGTQGTPLEVEGAYQIRHVQKGRYKARSSWSKVRSKIRRMQE